MVVSTTNRSPQYEATTANVFEMDVESATLIHANKLVCSKANSDGDRRYAVELDDIADAGDAAANREALADLFRGVALDGSASGSTDPIRVLGAGSHVYLQQDTGASIVAGVAVEPYADADNTTTHGGTVVAGSTSPIGVCIKTKTSAADKGVLCAILQPLIEKGQENA